MQFITYDKSNGKIVTIINSPEEFKSYYTSDAIGVIDFTGEAKKAQSNYYILNGEVVIRPVQDTILNKTTLNADGIDTIEITNAPTGIFTATNSETITGSISGSDTFATTIAGTYTITITSFPYLDFTATIEAI